MPIKPHLDYRLNKPYLTPIINIKVESPSVKTITINYSPIEGKIDFSPGQFVMVWIPGNDEIPMSISNFNDNNIISISVANVGPATKILSDLKIGDKIGIRGPYGNYYEPKPGTAIIVGGGIGMASVLPLIRQLVLKDGLSESTIIDKVISIEGVKNESELLYVDEISSIYENEKALEICTDDGSCGFKGFTTEKLELVLEYEIQQQIAQNASSPITVYTCGPEIMLKYIFEICQKHNIEVQASLERMMRCGFGICGLCALEPTGLLVCYDGPIFNNDILKETTDFGKFHRDFSGKKYKIGN